MTEPPVGWYYKHRAGSRAHFVPALRSYLDSLGRRLSIASEPSPCGRVAAGDIVDIEGLTPPANACVPCRRAVTGS